MRWRLEKTGNVVNGVAPNAPVRLVIDGAVPQASTFDLYQVYERLLQALFAKLQRRPGRPLGTLGLDLTASAPVSAGVCSELWEPAHLPPPESPTRYVAQVEDVRSPQLSVGSAVQFSWSHQSGAVGKLGTNLPAAPIEVGGELTNGSTLTLTGTAYCPGDPEIEIRSLIPTLGTSEEGELVEYIRRYVEAVGATMEIPELQSAFIDSFGDYLSHVHVVHHATPSRAEIPEEGEIEVELDLNFSYPARSLAAIGAYDLSGRLLAMSPLVAVSYDGTCTTVEF